ncbi:MAG TPA: hypothetical protein PKY59_25275 [Pyrinomonadaceae bacterium]|nr:hypothetical protein [Pyrinomonadaceae bacterium]
MAQDLHVAFYGFMVKRKIFNLNLFIFALVCGLFTIAVKAQDESSFTNAPNEERRNLSVPSKNPNTPTVSGFDNFYSVLEQTLVKRGKKREDICDEKDMVASRILREYGSVFLVIDTALPPPVCVFSSSEDVENFQKQLGIATQIIEGTTIELQPVAMEALIKARSEALFKGLDITPRDGSIAGRRGFSETARLWNSRFEPACAYWLKKGRLTQEQVDKLKALPMKEQVKEVLQLEKMGIYFNSAFNNSILYSVAAPGTSQHLALLAFDVVEFENEQVREILAKYGWYRTVQNDRPHFTFLGHKEEDLPKFGLKKVVNFNGKFWIPNT